jgi:hypothetical protein
VAQRHDSPVALKPKSKAHILDVKGGGARCSLDLLRKKGI